MKIQKLEIENFRRIEKAVINLEPASFIIGPNMSTTVWSLLLGARASALAHRA